MTTSSLKKYKSKLGEYFALPSKHTRNPLDALYFAKYFDKSLTKPVDEIKMSPHYIKTKAKWARLVDEDMSIMNMMPILKLKFDVAESTPVTESTQVTQVTESAQKGGYDNKVYLLKYKGGARPIQMAVQVPMPVQVSVARPAATNVKPQRQLKQQSEEERLLEDDINYYCRDYPELKATLLKRMKDKADYENIRHEMFANYMGNYWTDLTFIKNKMQLKEPNTDKDEMLKEYRAFLDLKHPQQKRFKAPSAAAVREPSAAVREEKQEQTGGSNDEHIFKVLGFSHTGSFIKNMLSDSHLWYEDEEDQNEKVKFSFIRSIFMDKIKKMHKPDREKFTIINVVSAPLAPNRSIENRLQQIMFLPNHSTQLEDLFYAGKKVTVNNIYLRGDLSYGEISETEENLIILETALNDVFRAAGQEFWIISESIEWEYLLEEFDIDLFYFMGGETHYLKTLIDKYEIKTFLQNNIPDVILSGFSAGIINCGFSTLTTVAKELLHEYGDEVRFYNCSYRKHDREVEDANRYTTFIKNPLCVSQCKGLNHNNNSSTIFPHYGIDFRESHINDIIAKSDGLIQDDVVTLRNIHMVFTDPTNNKLKVLFESDNHKYEDYFSDLADSSYRINTKVFLSSMMKYKLRDQYRKIIKLHDLDGDDDVGADDDVGGTINVYLSISFNKDNFTFDTLFQLDETAVIDYHSTVVNKTW